MTSQMEPVGQLRLYQGDSENHPVADSMAVALRDQLPILPGLMESFETVTGWELEFRETRNSLARRNAVAEFGSDVAPIDGKLEIVDMSARLEPGQTTRHRRPCSHLAETISELISLLQETRQSQLELSQQLHSVVDTPFDWWGISGKTGFEEGQVAKWSVGPNEQIRLFYATLDGIDANSIALAAATTLATFESACQAGIAFDQIAVLLPQVLRKTCHAGQRLEQFSCIEMDPITGEFAVDGLDASARVFLLDMAAGGCIDLEAEGMQGVLYSGQALLVGFDRQVVQEIVELVAHTEMTPQEFCRIIERDHPNSAAMVLYRK